MSMRKGRRIARWFFLLIAAPAVAGPTESQPAEAVPTQPADDNPPASAGDDKLTPKAKKPPYVTKAWGARLEPEPPGYVRTLSKTGIPGTQSLDWLDLGLEHRTRWDYYDDNYRRPVLELDEPFLLRSRGYVGVHDIIDPLRFGFEFEDARWFNSKYPDTNAELNDGDILQMFAELYFKDLLGKNEPLSFQVGRMTFDYVDRRLVARNRWRNTTSAFDGFRLKLGERTSDWAFDFFATQPVDRRMTQLDRPDHEAWFYGMVGAWRRWSQFVTFEPYYFILDQDHIGRIIPDREIHTMGLHSFGPIPDTHFDWDIDTAFQWGHVGDRDQRAYAHYAELGYTFEHPWKPRLSYSNAYATGDRDTTDGVDERFDRLFNVAHPFSTSDYFNWHNLIMNKIRIEFVPIQNIRADFAYGSYQPARDSDAWVDVGRRDPRGRSGNCFGQEFEARIRWQIDPRVELELGYSHFMPGNFVRNTGPADDSDFFYAQVTMQLFK